MIQTNKYTDIHTYIHTNHRAIAGFLQTRRDRRPRHHTVHHMCHCRLPRESVSCYLTLYNTAPYSFNHAHTYIWYSSRVPFQAAEQSEDRITKFQGFCIVWYYRQLSIMMQFSIFTLDKKIWPHSSWFNHPTHHWISIFIQTHSNRSSIQHNHTYTRAPEGGSLVDEICICWG